MFNVTMEYNSNWKRVLTCGVVNGDQVRSIDAIRGVICSRPLATRYSVILKHNLSVPLTPVENVAHLDFCHVFLHTS